MNDRRSGLLVAFLLAASVLLVWNPPPAHAAVVSSIFSDFEAGSPTAAGGNFQNCSTGTSANVTTYAYSGTTSHRVRACTSGKWRSMFADQFTNAGASAQYVLSARVLIPASTTVTAGQTLCVYAWSGWPNLACVTAPTADGQWHYVERTLTGSEMASPVYLFMMGGYGGADAGAIYYDDVSFAPVAPVTTTTTAPTTTTTTPPTTTTTTPPGNVEDFTSAPLEVATVADKPNFTWDGGSMLYCKSSALAWNGWEQGCFVSFVAGDTTIGFDVGAVGFDTDGSSGCEIYLGTTADGVTFRRKKQAEAWGHHTIGDLTPGTRYFLRLAHDGPTGESGSTCALDNLGPVRDRELGQLPVGGWSPTAGTDTDLPSGPSSTGQDGLDDCIPSGWSLVNPFAYVGAIGCSLTWAFLPDFDDLNVDDLRTAAEGKVPFSWISEVVSIGPAAQNALEDPDDCWIDLGYSEGLNNLGIDDGANVEAQEWDKDVFGTGCFSGGGSEVASDWKPRVRAIFAVMIWVALGTRLLAAAPWSKGRDSGEPGIA